MLFFLFGFSLNCKWNGNSQNIMKPLHRSFVMGIHQSHHEWWRALIYFCLKCIMYHGLNSLDLFFPSLLVFIAALFSFQHCFPFSLNKPLPCAVLCSCGHPMLLCAGSEVYNVVEGLWTSESTRLAATDHHSPEWEEWETWYCKISNISCTNPRT